MTNNKIKLTFGSNYQEVEVGDIVTLAQDKPLLLDCGKEISSFPIAYQAYGKLNEDKSNAILILHGLTGDQYVASKHPVTGKAGWWKDVVGKGKIIDTDRFFVICANVLGGCMGSYGPKSINPATGKSYDLSFPMVTVSDMVNAQKLLVDSFGIDQLFCIIGASMGGMLALQWAATYPNSFYSAVLTATSAVHNAQSIAFHEIGRQAIMADPNWCEGNYSEKGCFPTGGLAVARMTAHVTYMSDQALHRRFGRLLQDKNSVDYGFEADFQVESYLRHQGYSFVERFDPNSYLYITRAMDYFDLESQYDGVLADAFTGTQAKFCVMSFSSDWRFSTEESKHVVHALNGAAAEVSFIEVKTDKGHDAFLLDEPKFLKTLEGFINKTADQKGLT